MTDSITEEVGRTPGCVVIKGIGGCPDWFIIPVDGPDYLIGTQVSVNRDGGESTSPHGFAPNGKGSGIISRRHVGFNDKDGVAYVTDRGSRNGTELNGKKLGPDEEYALQNNDEISLAHGMILLRFKEYVQQEQEVASMAQPGPEKIDANLGLYVDVAKHEVYVDGNSVEPRIQMHEFQLLATLHEAHGNLVTMDKLSRSVWPERWDFEPEKREFGQVVEEEYWFPKVDNDTNNGDIHQLVKRVRTKLGRYTEAEHIQNVRGFGYKIV